VVWHGISEPPGRGRDAGQPGEDRRHEYRKRYAGLKSEGVPFFPQVVFKDAVMAVLVFGALCGLAWSVGAELEDLADPTDATYNPRPEWYFLFLIPAIKYFPGHLEAVAAVFLPGAALALLALVPFLDRGPRRHPLDRRLWTGLGIVAVGGFLHLTWAGLRSPLTNPVVGKDPLVQQGVRLYRDLKCAYCHSVKGEGGSSAPALDKVADGETEEWLERHFRDPQAVTPGSSMPKLNLLDEEVHALVAYMKSLGAGPFTPEASKLFAENCAACHKIGAEGSDVGPDLSVIGSARDKAFLKRYILDPSKVNPASSMPGYQGQLTEVQVEDLARYLASLRP
jgi:ubiquinol-cytochrome c reductase cytochrome b subunit